MHKRELQVEKDETVVGLALEAFGRRDNHGLVMLGEKNVPNKAGEDVHSHSSQFRPSSD